jgi:GAF domain
MDNLRLNSISGFSKVLILAFVVSLLLSIYLLFMLPSDLQFKGNVQFMDMVNPILMRLYIVLAITLTLACVAILAEMKNAKVAIVFKEKTAAQEALAKDQSESAKFDGLNSNAIVAENDATILSDSLSLLAKKLEAVAGACYQMKEENGAAFIELVSGFALPLSESSVVRFEIGEGMIGQVAKSGTPIYLSEIPDGYVQVVSGLGQSSPRFILILPMKKKNEVRGILEIASFKAITEMERRMAEKFANEVGEKLA